MMFTRKEKLMKAIQFFAWGGATAVMVLFLAFVLGFATHYTINAFHAGWNFYHGK